LNTASKNRLAFLFGPTGVGKTDVLAEHCAPWAEIVAVDSIQVYRGLDIGSAKPDAAARQRLPHHLIDIRDPDQSFDVGDFVFEADRAVHDILSRGKLPILSGGTAFYFVNFLYGLPTTPVSLPEYRQQSLNDWLKWGEPEFRRRLAEVDSVAEARIQPHDAYRLQRAWEVWLQTGKALSSFERSRQPRGGFEVKLLGLDRPRAELYTRIDARVDAMIEAGLEAEVRGLLDAGLPPEAPSLKAIGYAEFLPWLLEAKGSLADVKTAIAQNSRHYAKRQLTFFRSLPSVSWNHPDDAPAVADALHAWSLTFPST
jgi:tRNA dimethylallyltransferase